MPKQTLDIPWGSPLHADCVRRLESRLKLAIREQTKQHDIWQQAEERTLAFLPESTEDNVRRNKREVEGTPTFTTIQIPYSYALLMSAHTYWTSVFFARNPVHQFSGRHGEAEMQIQAMEALIGYQVETGGALGPYYIWLYDAGKYGAGVLGHYWCTEKLHFGSLVKMEDPATGKPILYQTTQEIQGYTGNRCYNVAPFDFLHDPRVTLRNFQKGEFCAVRCRMAWNDILRRADAGYFNSNIDNLPQAQPRSSDNQGSSVLYRPQFSTLIYDQQDEGHPAGAIFWETYVDLIPKEWGLGPTTFPQKWCFTITEDYKFIVG